MELNKYGRAAPKALARRPTVYQKKLPPVKRGGMGVHYDTPPCGHWSLVEKGDNKTMAASKKAETRFRNFATVVYPESAPENWLEILSDEKIPTFVSPLHDKDINPGGEPKKLHYHVMVMFEGKKSQDQVSELFSAFGGVGVEIVKSMRGYARYLCHMDNPEKAQYDQGQVKCFGGADYPSAVGLAIDKYIAIKEMIAFCDEMGILSYSDLLQYCAEERFDWFRILCDSGTIVMKEYLKSKYWTYRHDY